MTAKEKPLLAAVPRFALGCAPTGQLCHDRRNSGMRAKRAVHGVLAALLLAACAPLPSPPIDSPSFVRRPPPPGQPGYLETIRYIADGVRYVSAGSSFFVSAKGEMCFQGPVNSTMNPYVSYLNYWCMSPSAVGAVDAVRNDITFVDGVRLWCRISAPQCAHKVGYPNMLDPDWVANSITAETIPHREQRAAIRHLIYLMGGDLGEALSPEWHHSAGLDTPP
jgi:hypothetical protein